MIGLEAIKSCLIFFVLLAAAWTDISRMRIPNWLIGTGWILRIPFFIAEWGLGGKGALIQGGRELAGSVFLGFSSYQEGTGRGGGKPAVCREPF